MSLSDYCPSCKRSTWNVWGRAHVCDPKWLVWCPADDDGPEDGRPYHAIDAENAALAHAEWSDRECEHAICRAEDEPTYHVRAFDDDNAAVEAFAMNGEMVPSYSATRQVCLSSKILSNA